MSILGPDSCSGSANAGAIRSSPLFTALTMVVIAGLWGACAKLETRSDTPESAAVGFWESKPFMTQLGEAVYSLCLRNSGEFRLRIHAHGGDVKSEGRFHLEDGKIVLEPSPGKPGATVFELRKDELVRTDSNGETYHLLRSSETCPRP
jgi:hypothetical protein